ncbi:MAG: tRNA (adenosine(37)-N6)-threonylcarbamoyltransferase complex ATPase subunit type 1 TsaE [Planctomycetota bacterium]
MSRPLLTIETNTTEQTVAVGEAIGCCCSAGDLIALQGELGAGKTQLVRGIAKGMGLNPQQVSSPSYVMVQEYEPAHEKGETPLLVHIDAYRISSPDELESIGWAGHGEELRENAVVAIEWAKLIRPALGDDMLWVAIEHRPNGRIISISARGNWQDNIQQLSKALEQCSLDFQHKAEL